MGKNKIKYMVRFTVKICINNNYQATNTLYVNYRVICERRKKKPKYDISTKKKSVAIWSVFEKVELHVFFHILF